MPGFRFSSGDSTGMMSWVGDPTDEAAHQTILNWLHAAAKVGFLEPTESMSNAVKGNLGEFIAYQIGENYVFTNRTIALTANSWDPLSRISRPDIDIVWLYLGETEDDDWAAVQEVKTTGQDSLVLADDLVTDYDKLFGENLRLTLQTRLGALKNRLEQLRKEDYSERITALGGPSPNLARGIRIIPTLLHDSAIVSSTKMTAIRQALIGRGWSSGVVECWTVALTNLDDRLSRIARGQL